MSFKVVGAPAIEVEGLSKRYQIGIAGGGAGYQTFREAITHALTAPLRRFRFLRGEVQEAETIWALEDVDFSVQPGEVVGVIGRNGAGKSTLLKILSRITEPTRGRVTIRGRVASLLEVGTGFHPELTGRENIYLNGAILGMSRREITAKYDEIVEFAEVERFMDTPVKRYSSGMQVRLAFAVAAHLEPEILIVDEVLAVGDVRFQRKCLGRMRAVATSGRTVLFVSHNMQAVESLCTRAIRLDEGRLVMDADPPSVVQAYLMQDLETSVTAEWLDLATAPGDEVVRLRRASVRPLDGQPTDPITMSTPVVLEFECEHLQPGQYSNINFHLLTEGEVVAFTSSPDATEFESAAGFPVGLIRSRCLIPGDLLKDGRHRVRVRLVRNRQIIASCEEALVFDVLPASERMGGYYGKTLGAVRPKLNWEVTPAAGASRTSSTGGANS